jgi:hypothetical protein
MSQTRLLTLSLKMAVLIASISCCQSLIAARASGFSPEKAGFSVKFKEEVSPYRVIGVYVLPQEALKVEVEDTEKTGQYVLHASAGSAIPIGANKWRWRAPQETGFYPLKIIRQQPQDSITLNVFVMVPYDQLKGEYLGGYRIGKYPTVPYRQLPVYKPPTGFIKVTSENEETLVSPHFRLKHFLCKQQGDYPKYVVLRERLLLKLELILEKVNQKGYRCDTFGILSGYRTPYYNEKIGNVKYSRHVYGGAADIFIDEDPRDGMMDDLNHDGKIDYKDAGVIYDIVDDMYGKPWYAIFMGGLGRYKKTEKHGPFVHVDARGFRARWGD